MTTTTKLSLLLVGLTVSAPALAQEPSTPEPTPPAAAPPAPPAPSPELLQRLDEIDQRSRIVDRKLKLAEEAAAARKKEAPTVSADDKGFALSSADKAFELKLKAHLQVDARRHMDTSDPALADKDAFVLRRVRPIVEGTLLGVVDFRVMPDFGNNTTALYDAYLDAHPAPWLRLRAGKFKPSVGLERLQADHNLVFAERALDANLSAQREIGLQLWGELANAAVRYELAIYNGVPDGTILDVDSNHAKTYGGRLFLRPLQLEALKGWGDLGFGFAFSTGIEKGSSAAGGNTWLPTFKTAAQDTIYTYVASTTDATQTVFALGRHTRLNPQLYYYVGGFGLLADWVREYQQLGKGTTQSGLNHASKHLTVSYAIGGDSTFDGVKVKRVANWATKDVGAVEVALRYNDLDLDDVGFPGASLADPSKSVTKARGLGFALNWWLNRNIRVSGNWERTTFTGGAGTLKAVANRPTENVAIGRFQVAF